jgi:hypothetical protein
VAFEGIDHNGGGVVLDAVEISRDTNAFRPKFQVSEERVCSGKYVYFMIDTSNDFDNYTWDFGYGASPRYVSGYGPHTVQYTEPGEKTVKLAVNGTYNNIRKGALTVDTLPPKPTIDVNGDTLVTQSEGNIQWYDEDGIILGATDSIYIATEGVFYRVRVTNQYGCSIFSDEFLYTDINDSENHSESEKLKIFPVPAGEKFYLQYASKVNQRSKLTMVNTSGTVVREKIIELFSGLNRKSVQITGLSPGVYFIRLQLENGAIHHSRFIKK